MNYEDKSLIKNSLRLQTAPVIIVVRMEYTAIFNVNEVCYFDYMA